MPNFPTRYVYSSVLGRPQPPYSSREAIVRFLCHHVAMDDFGGGNVEAQLVDGCCQFNYYCSVCSWGSREVPHEDCPSWLVIP